MRSLLSIKRCGIIIVLILSLFLLAACQPSTQTASGEDTVTFTDDLGQTLTLAKNPSRVAALLGSFADVWQLAGGEVCAAANDAWEDFGFSSETAVRLGGAHSPNLELLLSSSPDLVLASASTASHVAMKDTLADMGIPVVYFDVISFDDYLRMLSVCTSLTGRSDLYAQNGTDIRDAIASVKADYAAQDLPASERTVLLLRASSGFVKAKGSEGTVLGEMLKDLGCINVADSDQTLLENLSVERVIAEEPRHIFVVTMGNDTEAANASLDRMMAENPAWGTLSAVREGRFYRMDKKLFNLKPNARWAEAYQTLYETIMEK